MIENVETHLNDVDIWNIKHKKEETMATGDNTGIMSNFLVTCKAAHDIMKGDLLILVDNYEVASPWYPAWKNFNHRCIFFGDARQNAKKGEHFPVQVAGIMENILCVGNPRIGIPVRFHEQKKNFVIPYINESPYNSRTSFVGIIIKIWPRKTDKFSYVDILVK